MEQKFDSEEAKKALLRKEEEERNKQEEERKVLLEKAISTLKEIFQNSSVEVYLVGSITRPFAFSSYSDIDVVLKNYTGDRFDCWTDLEEKMERPVEVILFETCHFKEFVLENGIKVV